ncbi:hypothetical protein ABQJ48_27550 [Paraburkholderia sp. DGU8]
MKKRLGGQGATEICIETAYHREPHKRGIDRAHAGSGISEMNRLYTKA